MSALADFLQKKFYIATGPNPWKVVILLEELGLPYHLKQLEFPELKQPAYENININGRVPAIEDPNTGITLWEVCIRTPFLLLY